MAFWKKSEDPWDQKPKPVGRPAPEEESPEPKLLDQVQGWMEQRKERKAKENAPPAPVPCPWCGKQMESGYLMGGGGIWWAPGRPDAWVKWLGPSAEMSGAVRVDQEGGLTPFQTAWACQDCRRLVLELPEEAPPSSAEACAEELRRYAEQAKER